MIGSSDLRPGAGRVARPAAIVVAALVALLLLLAAPALAVPPLNPDEPNDSFPTATALQNGLEVWGAIPEGDDEDYFFLDIPTSSHVTVVFGAHGCFRECGLAFHRKGGDTIVDLAWEKQYTSDDGSFVAEGTIGPGRLYAMVSLGNGVPGVEVYTIKVTYREAGSSTFPDVPAGSEFFAPINYLADEGVVSGYADGKFGPYNLVTRQQFAKMIVRAVGYPVSTSDICQFVDVQTSYPGYYLDPNDHLYPDHYIAVAAQRKITVGETPCTFGPYHSIKLAQVVTMVVRTAIDLGIWDAPPHAYVPPFEDFGAPHYSYARMGAAHGLFGGYPGPWNWYSPATRGQCAFFIWKLMLAISASNPPG